MGHPDGQAYAKWRGPNFIANPATPINSVTPIGASGQVTNYASVVLFISCNVPAGITVVLNWYTDSSHTIFTGSNGWTVANNQTLNVIVPAIGNYVQLTIVTGNVATVNMSVAMYPTNTQVARPSYITDGNFIQGNNQSIAGSATVIFPMPSVAAGDGYWFVEDPALTAKLQARLVTLTAAGAENCRMDIIATISGNYNNRFVAPAQPIGVEIINTDAVAHNVDYFCTVDAR